MQKLDYHYLRRTIKKKNLFLKMKYIFEFLLFDQQFKKLKHSRFRTAVWWLNVFVGISLLYKLIHHLIVRWWIIKHQKMYRLLRRNVINSSRRSWTKKSFFHTDAFQLVAFFFPRINCAWKTIRTYARSKVESHRVNLRGAPRTPVYVKKLCNRFIFTSSSRPLLVNPLRAHCNVVHNNIVVHTVT